MSTKNSNNEDIEPNTDDADSQPMKRQIDTGDNGDNDEENEEIGKT